jgi:hypothetical protein
MASVTEDTSDTHMDTSDTRTHAIDPTPEHKGTDQPEKIDQNKQPRSDAQKAALARARVRAMLVRQENAAQKEVEQFRSEQEYERKQSEKDIPTRD